MDATPRRASGSPRAELLALAWRRRLRAEAYLLVAAVLVVGLSAVLTPSDSVLTLLGWPVPPLCVWKNLTGMDCVGCGLTRSFTWMGHGELSRAWSIHRLGPVLYAAVAAQIPWRAFRLFRQWRLRPPEGDRAPVRAR